MVQTGSVEITQNGWERGSSQAAQDFSKGPYIQCHAPRNAVSGKYFAIDVDNST